MKNIMEVKRNELRDIAQISIAKETPVREKLESIISGEDDFTTHLNDGYVVRVHFGQEDYSATDALKQYGSAAKADSRTEILKGLDKTGILC